MISTKSIVKIKTNSGLKFVFTSLTKNNPKPKIEKKNTRGPSKKKIF